VRAGYKKPEVQLFDEHPTHKLKKDGGKLSHRKHNFQTTAYLDLARGRMGKKAEGKSWVFETSIPRKSHERKNNAHRGSSANQGTGVELSKGQKTGQGVIASRSSVRERIEGKET